MSAGFIWLRIRSIWAHGNGTSGFINVGGFHLAQDRSIWAHGNGTKGFINVGWIHLAQDTVYLVTR